MPVNLIDPFGRFGSRTEVQREPRNVGFRGQSGSRFPAAGGLFIAEGVEEVPRARVFIQNPGRYCINVASSPAYKNDSCTKSVGSDFFNTLSQQRTLGLVPRALRRCLFPIFPGLVTLSWRLRHPAPHFRPAPGRRRCPLHLLLRHRRLTTVRQSYLNHGASLDGPEFPRSY